MTDHERDHTPEQRGQERHGQGEKGEKGQGEKGDRGQKDAPRQQGGERPTVPTVPAGTPEEHHEEHHEELPHPEQPRPEQPKGGPDDRKPEAPKPLPPKPVAPKPIAKPAPVVQRGIPGWVPIVAILALGVAIYFLLR